eukprot:TRINITY_DN30518_c0_g1_i1.p1 TRINITY_DN30518_c0_g1~~TRINITY_DN30518_c0_g1_i1.p1  ORF type:complete len:171 (+),score=34.54 TRINITY_DN30518_c0_g1_i1:107-619(+)
MSLTLHITGPLGEFPVDATGSETVSSLKTRVGALLSVDTADFDLMYWGGQLFDMGMKVAAVGLCDGDEVTAQPSKRFVARRDLRELGWLATVEDLEGVVQSRYMTEVEKAAVVQLMIDSDEGLIESTDVFGVAPLHFAAESGSCEALRLLLDYYDVDLKDDGGMMIKNTC